MESLCLVVLCVIVNVSLVTSGQSFPSWFKFGAATSSYQIEGAWNVSDKTPSIWDQFVHDKPWSIKNENNGDVACNSYEFWKRDVEMTAELGLDFYRFSIAWPRLLPNGFSNYISEDGKKYYNDLIDGLIEVEVEPVVTLFHWDLPQSLQDLGGWTNPRISDWFADYAREVFKLYADRVKVWITINEPIVICEIAYDTGLIAPGIQEPSVASFLCIKNVLLAHAKTWRIYDTYFKPLYNGKVSISNHVAWYSPKTKDDERLTELVIEYTAGLYHHPIYSKEGGWPKAIEGLIANVSLNEGYQRSRLPEFTEEERELVKGTYDFHAFNYYTSRTVRQAVPKEITQTNFLSSIVALDAVVEPFPGDKHGYEELLTIHPSGLRNILKWFKESYGDIEVMITENGYSSGDHIMDDQERIQFIRDHLEQILLSIHEDGVNVTGYTYWTLMDNFEWLQGYYSKFGLYDVDFEDPLRQRTPKASATYYANIIKCRSLENCD